MTGRRAGRCQRWIYGSDGRTGFETFLSDMGPAPFEAFRHPSARRERSLQSGQLLLGFIQSEGEIIMGRITQETIERIKERLPVSAVVGKRVQFKRAGQWNYEGCRLSTRSAPPASTSMMRRGSGTASQLRPAREHFRLVCELEGLSFVEAVERLAHEAGVEVSRHGVSRECNEFEPRSRRRHGRLGGSRRFL